MPARVKREVRRVFITSRTTKYFPEKYVRSIIPALQSQVSRDFEPVWGVGAKIAYTNDPTPPGYSIVLYQMKQVEAGFEPYFFRDNYPVVYIAAEDLWEDHVLSDVLSHEILEMLVDPSCNLYAYRPAEGHRQSRGYFYEVCDPVQAHKYEIGGHPVSNFVYPEWFEYFREAGWSPGSLKLDHLGLVSRPFEVLPGCYADVFEARIDGAGRIHTIWGENRMRRRARHRHNIRY